MLKHVAFYFVGTFKILHFVSEGVTHCLACGIIASWEGQEQKMLRDCAGHISLSQLIPVPYYSFMHACIQQLFSEYLSVSVY